MTYAKLYQQRQQQKPAEYHAEFTFKINEKITQFVNRNFETFIRDCLNDLRELKKLKADNQEELAKK